ncbi:TlyA family RNA methyltransferase [uncultured Helicobacter sp.]|uniref:23S rRNA (cytidine-2'-O)-methyltransferase TlyA n=1 Tax=uncultured Helicobacter sp. TaxID=175537 RepID=UPI00263293BF|nr:TlyA family RNA methyltransferase [uncultured Helicobacter sp.]
MQSQDIQETRLDIACVKLGLCESRNKAQNFIKNGKVCVNGEVCQKVSYEVSPHDSISLLNPLCFVSRAGEKLYYFLKSNPHLTQEFGSLKALDIGASAGGFSEVLLKAGVPSIVCVDVGSNQLHISLRQNPRVKFYERTDIRKFAKEYKESQAFSLVVCDVSFISLKEILSAIKVLASGLVILLFKPQFEVGIRVKRNKKGVLMDSQSIIRTLEQMLMLLNQEGFKILVCEKSKVRGKEGNVEFFIAATKAESCI